MVEDLLGIVVQESDYRETSKLLTLITKEHGIISVISKGCRSIKSELRSASTILTYGKFSMYYKGDKLSNLVSVDIINNFKNTRIDLNRISFSSYLLELTTQVMKQNNTSELFDILIQALTKIDEGFDPVVISDIVSLKYLDYLGVMPVIDSCAVCGSTTSIATLSSDLGGYVCNKCRNNEPIVSEKAIKLVRMFYYIDISKIEKLDVSLSVKREIHLFLDRYYDRYTGLYFKTKKMLKVSD